jgi:hypothetical protein
LRAARLLEGRGDKDGAIERYKLALEANPQGRGGRRSRCATRTRRGATRTSVVALVEKELDARRGEPGEGASARRARARAARRSCTTTTRPRPTHARRRSISTRPTPTRSSSSAISRSRASVTSRRASTTSRSSAARPSLPKEDAVRVLVRFVEAFGRSVSTSRVVAGHLERDGSRESLPPSSIANHPRLLAAVDALEQIAPDDAEASSRVGARRCSTRRRAAAPDVLHRELLERHGGGARLTRTRRRALAPRRVAPPRGRARRRRSTPA